MTVKLSSALPREAETNGLNTDRVEQRIAADPTKPLVVLATLVPHTRTEDLDSDGNVSFAVKVDRIEVLDPVKDQKSVRSALKLLSDTAQARTGTAALDFTPGDTSEPWGGADNDPADDKPTNPFAAP